MDTIPRLAIAYKPNRQGYAITGLSNLIEWAAVNDQLMESVIAEAMEMALQDEGIAIMCFCTLLREKHHQFPFQKTSQPGTKGGE